MLHYVGLSTGRKKAAFWDHPNKHVTSGNRNAYTPRHKAVVYIPARELVIRFQKLKLEMRYNKELLLLFKPF